MAQSSTFSGSAVAASVTFTSIIKRCSVSLNDEAKATWDTEMLGNWLNDAIREYSQYFPRILTDTISCATGTNAYELNSDYIGVISVEYPTGEDPPEYLSRLSYKHRDFWTGSSWYDILPRADDDDLSEIWIANDPTTGESIEVQYNAHHALMSDPAAPTGDNTVPPAHQHLLVKYVIWQASLHLMFAEEQSPTSNSSLLMAQLSQNARRSEASYHTSLRQALYAADGVSEPAQWITASSYSTDNSLARIY